MPDSNIARIGDKYRRASLRPAMIDRQTRRLREQTDKDLKTKIGQLVDDKPTDEK